MFEIFSNWVAAFFTLCIFSFLYKDNPFYKFAEYLFVGVSAGYAIPLTWEAAFIPYVYRPIFLQHKFIFIIPALIGALYIFTFNRKLNWLSRFPIAFGMGMVGMGVPLSMHAGVLVQMRGAMVPIQDINTFLVFVGTVTILLYFYFSKAHTGTYGKIVKVGIWYMMIGFGASFGYTVMARISLLIGRIQFLVADVLHIIK
ncbi:MAG: hypothetical protein PHY08_04530 [Candidatus Cloacimonetes bacterium]|jgi:hypothetical protein|nr:hypothetical protein [Candidatus Cloacimonadota bacterium]MDD4155821.1 hypothetical protein [Candidatus Cloacimonadota bacterium]